MRWSNNSFTLSPAETNGKLSPTSNGHPPDTGPDSSGDDNNDRGQWGNKAEFLLSCIGLSVGLGNVWRFPYLAYQHGGAAFLIAYIILQIFIGKPLYLMELIMGQFSGKGPTKVWDMNPAAKGVGIAMALISLDVSIYYNVIMTYTLFYLFSSMQTTLPWTVCKEEWENCQAVREPKNISVCTSNFTLNSEWGKCECNSNSTINQPIYVPYNCSPLLTSSTEMYFYTEVIQRSEGLEPENMGKPVWKLALCLLLAWIIVCFCLIKGIKSSGKVVYFTATFPYIILLILLIRGSLLEGAGDGVDFFIIPKWEKLAELDVWVAAAGQMFFSLSVSFGGILMYGSYNKFRNKVYGDALLISTMDLITSVIAGFVVFTTLGNMAYRSGVTVDKVAKAGYGLAFIAYPEALSNLPPPQLWSVLFFFMLLTLGLDSEFANMETVMTCIQDEFPFMRKYKTHMTITLSICCYLLALPCVCNGGDYVVTIMDYFGGDSAVLLLSCFETISVMWIYGVRRFLKDIEYMLGGKPHVWQYFAFNWVFTAPILTPILFLYRMIKYTPHTYPNGQEFPIFAQAIGWTLMCVVLSPLLFWFIWHVARTIVKNRDLSTKELLRKIFEPTSEWCPNDGNKNYLNEQTYDTPDNIQMSQVGYDNPGMVVD